MNDPQKVVIEVEFYGETDFVEFWEDIIKELEAQYMDHVVKTFKITAVSRDIILSGGEHT